MGGAGPPKEREVMRKKAVLMQDAPLSLFLPVSPSPVCSMGFWAGAGVSVGGTGYKEPPILAPSTKIWAEPGAQDCSELSSEHTPHTHTHTPSYVYMHLSTDTDVHSQVRESHFR